LTPPVPANEGSLPRQLFRIIVLWVLGLALGALLAWLVSPYLLRL
jgi:hypothetical protein